jgi:hypothetical protein
MPVPQELAAALPERRLAAKAGTGTQYSTKPAMEKPPGLSHPGGKTIGSGPPWPPRDHTTKGQIVPP